MMAEQTAHLATRQIRPRSTLVERRGGMLSCQHLRKTRHNPAPIMLILVGLKTMPFWRAGCGVIATPGRID